jgi:ribosomal protein S21
VSALRVEPRAGENGESLLTRFTKMVQRDGILREAKNRRHFSSNGELKRMARQKALRRIAKQLAKDEARMRR